MTINYNNSSINRLIFIVLIVLLIAIVIVLSTSRSNKNIAIITDVITDSIVSKNIHHTREEYNSSDHILDKFIYSNYSRLLLVAGLEGTGHHAISDMVNVCMHAPPGRSCSPDRDLTLNLMHEGGKKGGLFYAEAAGITRQLVPPILSRMELLSKQTQSHLYFLGLGKVAGAGMLSYPNYAGSNKELNHPDAYSLALMAELQNLDFRVLVLQRDPRDIIASVKRRNFGGSSEIRILTQNADDLYTQLSMMSPSFYRCIQYEHINTLNDNQKNEFSIFLHPEVIPPVLTAMLGRLHYKDETSSSSSSSSAAATPSEPHSSESNHIRHTNNNRNTSRSNNHPIFEWNEKITAAIKNSTNTPYLRGTGRRLDENTDDYKNVNIGTDIKDILNNDYRNRAHYEESQLASRLLLINDLCSKTRSQI